MTITESSSFPGVVPAVSGWQILIVDDDPDCREEYAEIAATMGYDCLTANNTASALQAIAGNSRIGLVITDLQMPGLDGIAFLDELDARFGAVRPLVTIVATGHGTIGLAAQAMRSNAADFLTKPLTRDELIGALRRGSARLNRSANQLRLAEFSEDQETEAGESAVSALPTGDADIPGGAIEAEDETGHVLRVIQGIIKSHELRERFVDANLLSDATWNILLELTAAKLEGKSVPINNACIAAKVSPTTGLRHIKVLLDSGLVRQWKDPHDRRRTLLELEDHALAVMRGYITAISPR